MADFNHISFIACLLLTLVKIISSTEAIIERHCDPRILVGYDQCLCDYTQLHDVNGGYTLKSINCTNQHFSEVQSLARLRPLSVIMNAAHYTGLERFIFIGNTIHDLPVNVFGTENLSSLTYVDLSHNHIHTIHGQTFHGLPTLMELNLSNNDLYVNEHSPRVFSSMFNLEILRLNNAFFIGGNSNEKQRHVTVLSKVFERSNLDYLRELYLEYNNIPSVNADVFQRLPSIEKISLAHNHINNLEGLWNSTCIPSDFVNKYMNLDHFCRLTFLDLRYNSITTVPKTFLDELAKLKAFKTLYLHYNPFNCDCNLHDFYDWLRSDVDNSKYTIVNHGQLKCMNPPHLKGRPIITLTKNDLVCLQATYIEPSYSMAVIIILGTMFGVITVLFLVALYVNHERAMEKAGNIWKRTSGLFQKWMGDHDDEKCPNINKKLVEV